MVKRAAQDGDHDVQSQSMAVKEGRREGTCRRGAYGSGVVYRKRRGQEAV
jgi:hypothetical protein